MLNKIICTDNTFWVVSGMTKNQTDLKFKIIEIQLNTKRALKKKYNNFNKYINKSNEATPLLNIISLMHNAKIN